MSIQITDAHRENIVNITGKVKQVETREGVSQKSGSPYIAGNAVIEAAGNEFKVSLFSMKTTKAGNLSKTYEGISSLENGQLVSLLCNIEENKFVGADGTLVKTQQLSVRFVGKPRENDTEGLSFNVTGYVVSPLREVRDKEDNLTHFEIKLGQSKYNPDLGADIITLAVNPDNQSAVQYIQSSYPIGTTARFGGIGKGIVETTEVVKEAMFGASEKQVYQNHVQRLYIESGFEVGDFARYTPEMIKYLTDKTQENEELLKARTDANEATKAQSFDQQPSGSSAADLLGL